MGVIEATEVSLAGVDAATADSTLDELPGATVWCTRTTVLVIVVVVKEAVVPWVAARLVATKKARDAIALAFITMASRWAVKLAQWVKYPHDSAIDAMRYRSRRDWSYMRREGERYMRKGKTMFDSDTNE